MALEEEEPTLVRVVGPMDRMQNKLGKAKLLDKGDHKKALVSPPRRALMPTPPEMERATTTALTSTREPLAQLQLSKADELSSYDLYYYEFTN